MAAIRQAFREVTLSKLTAIAESDGGQPFEQAVAAMLEPGARLGSIVHELRRSARVIPFPSRFGRLSAELLSNFSALVDLHVPQTPILSMEDFAALPSTSWPWLPVGQVGPLVVLGHCSPVSPNLLGLPEHICPRVWLPPKVYLSILRLLVEHWPALPHQPAKLATRVPLPQLRARLAELPEDDRPATLVPWILDNLPLAEADRDALRKCVEDDIYVLPSGFAAAVDYLSSGQAVVDARELAIEPRLAERVPRQISERYKALCFFETEQEFYLLASGTEDRELEDQLVNRLKLEKELIWVVARTNEIQTKLQAFEKSSMPSSADAEKRPESSASQLQADVVLREEAIHQVNPKNINTTPEQLLQWLLYQSIAGKASDIHFEQHHEQARFRARVDGDLVTLHTGPLEQLFPIVAMVKNHSNMTMNNNDAQDGRFSIKYAGRVVDARVSAIPWRKRFQKLTLRLLDKSSSVRTLDEVGLEPNQLRLMREVIQHPQGMILVTGPTGSGKTTFLYAALNELAKPNLNVQTIEDPIEYEMEGINQTQVDERQNLNFSSLLRRILRADPDVIMVGEIRDRETASTAADAALTGHMVFTTLHSLDSVRSVARLLSIGVPSYMLSDALLLLHAQRLIRKLCPCREEIAMPPEMEAVYRAQGILTPADKGPFRTFRKVGCPDCGGSGYRGRTAVIELCPVTGKVRDLIYRAAPSDELLQQALVDGFEPMFKVALRRALTGITSFEECLTLKQY